VVAGIGDEIATVEGLPPAWLLLANPRVATPTPAVFKARQGAFSSSKPWGASPKDFAQFAARLRSTSNDLTEAAISVTPAIRDVLVALASLPGCALARLSGSGATCFGLFADERTARAAEASLRAAESGWWVAAAAMAR
jgi:4-diphosphocytidyl-2-C-methyl-D-erythritol kinase